MKLTFCRKLIKKIGKILSRAIRRVFVIRRLFIIKKLTYAKASVSDGGAGGSRTRVRIRNRNGFYMLSSCSVFREQHGREQNLHCFLAPESFTQSPRQCLSYTSFTVTPLYPAATGQRCRRGGSPHGFCLRG